MLVEWLLFARVLAVLTGSFGSILKTVIDLDKMRCADWSRGANQVLLQTTKTLINPSTTDLEVSSITIF